MNCSKPSPMFIEAICLFISFIVAIASFGGREERFEPRENVVPTTKKKLNAPSAIEAGSTLSLSACSVRIELSYSSNV